jgi:hypothetical protein
MDKVVGEIGKKGNCKANLLSKVMSAMTGGYDNQVPIVGSSEDKL